jgi:fluoroquinolone resistance protein
MNSVDGFSKDYYEDEIFNELDISAGELVDVEFHSCDFNRGIFTEAQIKGCLFRGCVFDGCDLNMLKVPDSVFIDSEFNNSKLMAVDWSRAAWERAELIQVGNSLKFSGCVLDFSVFMGVPLNGVTMENCMVREADFSDASLQKADFRGANLEKAVFRNTNLADANFVGAENYFISAQNNNLKGAIFSLPEAMSLLYGLGIELVHAGEEPN